MPVPTTVPASSSDRVSSPTPSVASLLRTLLPRDGFQFKSSSTINISKNTYIYIVFLGIIPIVVVTCVITWALCFYGRDRICCPCCKSRKDKSGKLKKDSNSGGGSDVNENIMMRAIPAQAQPGSASTQTRTRPPPTTKLAKRPLTAVREDSGLSAASLEEDGERSPSLRGFV
ncbi:hypothetical protein K458DRAFT_134856 [Lentithecium fluviatile CBS 122367]|uniref:Uncharacterized protein n=1 Tax=Lentithecium fluviatile CBS 122367 TaxID=1168545 RepID=A0A6G1IKL2_9PLEO|nr:hypothetical protein K458DRAFT_134856 [Lentithecium fluviatile CBS 122367]